jgi:hypothetical protein
MNIWLAKFQSYFYSIAASSQNLFYRMVDRQIGGSNESKTIGIKSEVDRNTTPLFQLSKTIFNLSHLVEAQS